MKGMKTPFLTLILALALPFAVSAMEFPFESTTDYQSALKQAKQENEPVMLVFVAKSCGHCQRLKEQVFSKDEFSQFAEENLVPVIYDFQQMDDLSADDREQAQSLAKEHQVTGTPTILLLTPDEEVIMKSVGYGGSGVEETINVFKERIAAEYTPNEDETGS
jgi:thioredoxin-related protein